MSVNRRTQELLLTMLDRMGASAQPFWEGDAVERGRIADLFGDLEVSTNVEVIVIDGEVIEATATIDGSLLLALGILGEITIDALIGDATARNRHDAIGRIRVIVDELLTD